MIKIINPPPYGAAYEGVIYRVEGLDPEKITDIEVIDNSQQVIGIKRFAGRESCEVNVANYYLKKLDPQAQYLSVSGFLRAEGRDTETGIRVGGVESGRGRVLAAAHSSKRGGVLTEAPTTHTISTTEWDEIALYAPNRTVTANLILKGENQFKIGLGQMTLGEGVWLFILNMASIAKVWSKESDYHGATLQIVDGSLVVVERDYQIVESDRDSVRLCWLNPQGGVDYYTFGSVLEQSITATKNRFYSGDGHSVGGSSAQTQTTFHSQLEPANTIRWLATLLSSPRVWIATQEQQSVEQSDRFVSVDVVTSNVSISGELPGTLSVTVRERRKRILQHN